MKEIIKFSLYHLIFSIVRCLPVKARQKQLILVKTDEIGDYLLIRNLLPFFKKYGLYKHHKITFVGNKIFKDLFAQYDSHIADETIWLDKKKFKRDIVYRFRFLRKVRSIGASAAINLVYSRNFRTDDVIMAVTAAPARIGMQRSDHTIPSFERWLIPDNIYTQLAESGPEKVFDALRNARFIEEVLSAPALPVLTAIPAKEEISSFALPSRYFVVFPGSGIKEKKWPASHFAAVARHVASCYQLAPVVCGAPGDEAECAAFLKEYAGPVTDLSGRTSLPQLLTVLKQATTLISVDTGSVHLAAAVGCPVFALFSGAHYGRFAPYPKEIALHFYPVYPDEIDEIIEKGLPVDFDTIPPGLVKKISPEKLIREIDRFIPIFHPLNNSL